MLMRLVHLWSARAKPAVNRRILSDTLPRRAVYFSNGPTLSYCSWPTLRPRCAVFTLLKTRNQLTTSVKPHEFSYESRYRGLHVAG
jgi:hypothetical protein